jgi:hypothetical protein
MPEKAAFFQFYSAFYFIPREISGLVSAARLHLPLSKQAEPQLISVGENSAEIRGQPEAVAGSRGLEPQNSTASKSKTDSVPLCAL